MVRFNRPQYNEIRGTHESETLTGGEERDRIYGWGGDDLILGQGNDDVLSAGSGEDTIFGGTGNDFIYAGQEGKKSFYGEEGNDKINGLYNEDTLRGGSGNDTLSGGSPRLNDTDFTGDWLFGEEGDDRLRLGSHFNLATGGEGADTFAFTLSAATTTTPDQVTVIEDFNPDEGDKIEVDYILHFPTSPPDPGPVVPIVAVGELSSIFQANSTSVLPETTNSTAVEAVDPLTNFNVASSVPSLNKSVDLSKFNIDISLDLDDIIIDPGIDLIVVNRDIQISDFSYNSDTGALFLKDIQFAQLSPGLDLVLARDLHVETFDPPIFG